MYISSYRSDAVGARLDETTNPSSSPEIVDNRKVGFGQNMVHPAIQLALPMGNPQVGQPVRPTPTQSDGYLTIAQSQMGMAVALST